MSETRCELTDLLRDQCAHCLGHDQREATGDLVIERVITASYEGRCALNGHHPIEPGDSIGHTEHGWLCTRCTQGGAR